MKIFYQHLPISLVILFWIQRIGSRNIENAFKLDSGKEIKLVDGVIKDENRGKKIPYE